MSWGVVKLEKSLNFLSSLEWQLSLFLLMLGVRACCCCRRSSFLRSIEPLPYWCQLAFIQSRRAPFSSSCFSQHSQHSPARKEGRAASWISHVCERVYILWNWNGKGGGVLSSALEGREGGILKISSRDSTVRCSSFPWQLINSTVFALACWQAFLTGSSSRWWALATAFPFPFFSCLF